MSESIQKNLPVPAEYSGKRLDQVAALLLSDYSRSRIQEWIKQGAITVNGQVCKAKHKLISGEVIDLNVQLEDSERWQPQSMTLNVVYEDPHIIVINKPVGLIVHPGAGAPDGTLLNGLLYRYPELSSLPRAGIVHRLDKDTSGLMVVARSLLAHTHLVKQLQDRSVGREYEAIVMGELTGGGVIDKPIGRHPTHRVKMAVLESTRRNSVWGKHLDKQDDGDLKHAHSGKEAITHYRLLSRFVGYTHIACQLETGRTHQIRVHLSHIKHPLVGDPVYLGRQRWVSGSSEALQQALQQFSRQALHAKKLSLIHPESHMPMSWESELAEDMQVLLETLRQEASTSQHIRQ